MGVILWLDSLVGRQQLVGQTQLVGSDDTEVSGVRNVGWQTGDGLLRNRVLLVDDVVELETHLSVAGVGTEGLGQRGDGTCQNWLRQNPVGCLDDAGDRCHDVVDEL